ncbi:hypothetical protein ACH4Q7_22575 [Streptomyces roseolus]|uniref:hypothetical protein n=1 Tax=Streptomyces roseolus TaxID=67358 RepID=UPI00379C50EC
MRAHLYAVPDPDPGEQPGPGPRPVPTALPAIPAQPDAPDAPDVPDEVDAPDETEGERDEEGDQEDDAEAGEEPRRGGLPDLSPYYDVRGLAELGPLAVEVGKKTAPPIARGLLRLIVWLARCLLRLTVWLARGAGVLLTLLMQWLGGQVGKKLNIGARWGLAALTVWAVARSWGQHPAAPWVIGGVALLLLVMAAAGHIHLPESKPAKAPAKKGEKGDAKAPAKGKEGAASKDSKGEKDAAPEASAETPAEEEKAPQRAGLLARVTGRWKSDPEEDEDQAEEDDEEEGDEDPEEDDEETPVEGPDLAPAEGSPEAPADPSREALIEALHHLYRGGSGVLHTALRDHLSLPDTRAVKRLLDGAGIPHKPGVRTPAGNGPGTHRQDFPAPPPAQGSPQGAGVVAGQMPTTNNNNSANASEGQGGGVGGPWTPEEITAGRRYVPDPERGPTAWKIQHYRGE